MAPLTPYRRTGRSFNFNPLPSPTFTNSMTSAADDSWTADEDMADAREAEDYSRAILPRGPEHFPGTESPIYGGEMGFGSDVDAFALQLDRFLRSRGEPGEEESPNQLASHFLAVAQNELDDLDRNFDELAEISGRDPRRDNTMEWEEEDFVVESEDGGRIDFRDLWQHRENCILEIRTWDLFRMLPDALAPPSEESSKPVLLPAELAENNFLTNRELFRYLKDHDIKVKHLGTIMRWLVDAAPEPEALDSGFREGGWIYTKARIKNAKRIDPRSTKARNFLASTSTRWALDRPVQQQAVDGVSELDPDAPLRQQKELEPEDREAEELIMRSVFTFLRAKDLPGAVQLCKDVGEQWRGHTLIGSWETYDDERIEHEAQRFNIPGTDRRELWRRTCFNLARNESVGPFEQASYGLLAGDLQTVLPVCESWEDHLFAHVNSLVESYFSHFLQENGRLPAKISSFEIYDFLQHHGLNVDHLPRIIDALQKVEELQIFAKVPQRILQGSLMSGRFFSHVEDLVHQSEIIRNEPDYDPTNDPTFRGIEIGDFQDVRVIVHILIVNKFITGQFAPTEMLTDKAESLISTYIEYIAVAKKYELTPLYAGLLSAQRAIDIMGQVLVEVEEEELRRSLISSLNDHEISVKAVLEKLLKNVLTKTKGAYLHEAPATSGILGLKSTGVSDKSKITDDDWKMIKAVEWMLLNPGMETAMAEAGCHILNRFFSTGRLAAAAELISILPSQAITDAENSTPISEEDSLYRSLYISYETFIHALLALEDWKRLVRSCQPTSKTKPSRTDLESALTTLQTTLRPTITTWLADYPSSRCPADTLHAITLSRKLYIPDLTLALHQVYLDAGRLLNKAHYMKCLELSVQIADGRNTHALEAWRESGRLSEYVNALAEAGKVILGASEGVKKGKEGGLGIWNVV